MFKAAGQRCHRFPAMASGRLHSVCQAFPRVSECWASNFRVRLRTYALPSVEERLKYILTRVVPQLRSGRSRWHMKHSSRTHLPVSPHPRRCGKETKHKVEKKPRQHRKDHPNRRLVQQVTDQQMGVKTRRETIGRITPRAKLDDLPLFL